MKYGLVAAMACAAALVFGTARAQESAHDPVRMPLDPPAGELGGCRVEPAIVIEGSPTRVAGAPFSFSAIWDTSVTNRPGWQAVLQQAINEWQGRLTDSGCQTNPLPVYIRVRPLGGNLLGLTVPLVFPSGCIARDTITFNPNYSWFIDPTPGNDSEFNDPVLPPPAGYDLLTVARHELGHAVGWTLTAMTSPNMVDSTYAPVRLNVLTTQTIGVGWHVNPQWLPKDLMVPSVGESVRRGIANYPDVATVAHGFGGAMNAMLFVDPTYGGFETGSPASPFRTLPPVQDNAPAAWQIMLANTTHHVPVNYTTSTVRFIDTVRGGATIVAP